MDYMTLKEAAEKWGVSPRRVNYYCAGERIPRRCEDGRCLAHSQNSGKAH